MSNININITVPLKPIAVQLTMRSSSIRTNIGITLPGPKGVQGDTGPQGEPGPNSKATIIAMCMALS